MGALARLERIRKTDNDEFAQMMKEAAQRIETLESELADLQCYKDEQEKMKHDAVKKIFNAIRESSLRKIWDIELDSYEKRTIERQIEAALLNF